MADATVGAARKQPGLLRRLVERPQQVWLRKAFFQVHLWAGVLLALYVIAIGVSGSILVFKEELMPKPHVHVGRVDYNACTPEKLQAAAAKADAVLPGMTTFLTACPTPANSLYTITVHPQPKREDRAQGQRATQGGRGGPRPPQRSIYIHPVTGEVVGSADREHSWLEWVEQFHVNLLLGRSGRLWNGIGAAALLVLTLTGMVLWWPGIRNWTRSLRVDFRKNWKRINYDLHSAMGFWTVFFTLTWALTGMYFTWPKLFTTPLQVISRPTTANYPAAEVREAQARLQGGPGDAGGADRHRRGSSASRDDSQQPVGVHAEPRPVATVDVSGMLRAAQSQSPRGHLEGYFYGSGPHAVFTVYLARGILGDYSNTDFVYFDQRSGTQLHTWHRGENHTLADWVQWMTAPLHFGTSWGQDVKALWFLLGLALPLLTITGVLMYWNRWLSKRWQNIVQRNNRQGVI